MSGGYSTLPLRVETIELTILLLSNTAHILEQQYALVMNESINILLLQSYMPFALEQIQQNILIKIN